LRDPRTGDYVRHPQRYAKGEEYQIDFEDWADAMGVEEEQLEQLVQTVDSIVREQLPKEYTDTDYEKIIEVLRETDDGSGDRDKIIQTLREAQKSQQD
jgi:uncharacterized protein YutE (UPF0331/DUF86 family)